MISKVELKLLRIIIYNPGKKAEELEKILWPKPCRCGSIQWYLSKLEKRGLILGYGSGVFVSTHAGEDVLASR